MHIHDSLSNVAIHMPCVNMHLAGHYQLEMVFAHVYLLVIPMGDDALHGSDCISTTVVWKYFVVKKFSWVMKPTKIYYTKKVDMNSKQGAQ